MYTTYRNLQTQKHIALVAHDHCKDDLIQWCKNNRNSLKNHILYATGTTGTILQQQVQLEVNCLRSGPMGGDQQIGALIAENKIDILIFFWDPMNAVPHDPDVKALMRIATVWNIPVAMNIASANFLINSPCFAAETPIRIPDYQRYLNSRTK